MDDPWAAPSWSTPAKPSSSSPPAVRGMTMSPPRAQSTFDVSDPWGAPAAPAPSLPAPSFEPKSSGSGANAAPETPGWGHEASWDTGQVPAPRPPEPGSRSPGSASIQPQSDYMPSWGGSEGPLPSSPPPKMSFEPAPASPHLTPPRSFPSLPEFASPRSPLSHHSPHSHRSMTPTLSYLAADEEDPEAVFAAALPSTSAGNDLPTFDMPKSPSFGEGDFGGFSSGPRDPWGGREKVGWGGDDKAEDRYEGAARDDEAGGDGWGSARPVAVKATEPRMEQDWEAAQRKIKLQESLVPHDKVERLRTGWKEVAGAAIGLRKLPEPSDDETRDLETALRKLEIDRDESLRSLAAIPPDINTYPPVLSSFTTHSAYLTSLSRPNPSPSTSFLNTSSKRPRRDGVAVAAEQDRSASWLSRSRLGEPEATSGDAAPAEAEGKSRWAFWGRRPQPERQLTTSGGGVLEVKGSALPAVNTSGELRKSSSQQFAQVPSTGRTSVSQQQSPASSRPTSLFDSTPVDITSPHASAAIASPLSATTTGTTQPTSAAMAPAPSAVSRFFGRLRRNPSSGPTPSSEDFEANAKDLELGEDDFSFLGQVPTLAPLDLLDQHPKASHEMASLEDMIASKPTPLPAPLAPPPARDGGGRSGTGATRRNDMDLLSGLYDEDGDMGGEGNVAMEISGGQADPIGWNDFLGPSPSAAPQPRAATQNPAPMFPSPVPTPSTSSIQQATPASDFDDFGTPAIATSGRFDDFGDFSAFDDTPPPPPPRHPTPGAASAPTPAPSAPSQRIPFFLTPSAPTPPPTSYTSPLPLAPTPSIQTHRPRPSLDHTPALNLVNDASITKGRRWPAPPSPDIPDIAPPPPSGKPRMGASFPFLSPPPPPRPGSRAGTHMRDMLGEESMGAAEQDGGGGQGLGMGSGQGLTGMQAMQQALMSPVSVARPLGSSAMLPTPPRSSTPVAPTPAPAAAGMGQKSGGNSGLSAQDLSFFDNL